MPRRTYAPSRRFSPDGELAERSRGPPARARSRGGRSASGARRPSRVPSKTISPRRAHRVRDRPQRRRLAGAVRAEHGDHLPLRHLERDAVQRLDLARSGPRRPRARAAATSGLVVRRAEVGLDHRRVAAAPPAASRPRSCGRSRARARGRRSLITRFMWCSTSRTVSSKSSRICWMNAPSCSTSSWESPPAGSSRSSSFGAETSARARLDALQRPVRQRARGPVGDVADADVVDHLVARCACGPLGAARVACAPTRTFSRTVIVLKSSRFWKVRAIPRRIDPVRRRREQALALEAELAGVRPVQARDHVERRRLAGAVRADQPDDLALADVERDVVERDDPAEAAGDVANLEQRHGRSTLRSRASKWKPDGVVRRRHPARGLLGPHRGPAPRAAGCRACRAGDVVVIGGGAMGASVAWHLRELGVDDVLLVERDSLAAGLDVESAGGDPHAVRRRAERADRAALAGGVRADGRDRPPPARLPLPARPAPRTWPTFREALALQQRARRALARAVGRRGARDRAAARAGGPARARRSASSTATARPRRSSSGTRAGCDVRQGCEVTGIDGRGRAGRRRRDHARARSRPARSSAARARGRAEVAALAGVELPVEGETRWMWFTPEDGGLPEQLPLTIDFSTSLLLPPRGAGPRLRRARSRRSRRSPSTRPGGCRCSRSCRCSRRGGATTRSARTTTRSSARRPSRPASSTQPASRATASSRRPAVGEHLAELVAGVQPTLDLSAFDVDALRARRRAARALRRLRPSSASRATSGGGRACRRRGTPPTSTPGGSSCGATGRGAPSTSEASSCDSATEAPSRFAVYQSDCIP